MNIPKDPFMLQSVVNTKLRDFYPSLSDLCDGEDVPQAELEEALLRAGLKYDETQNSVE